MDLLAKQGIQIISTEDRIEITSPKEIVITAGGSQIKLNGSGIFPVTSGKFEAKAGQHLFMDGATISPQMPVLPEMDNPYILQYLVKNKENQALMKRPYLLIDEKGVTDRNGFMNLKTTASAQSLTTRVMVNEIEEAEEDGNAEE